MKVSWADVGYTETARDVDVDGELVVVAATAIAAWKQEPGAVFAATRYGRKWVLQVGRP